MKVPNFTSINPSNRWTPNTNKGENTNIFKALAKTLSSNRLLILPHSTIIALALMLLGTNLFYNSTKNELEPYHEQYRGLVSELNTLKSSNEELEKQYTPAYEFILNSLHPFVFAKELQQLIPRDVQLKSYVLSNTTVSLEASSVMQRSIDDFIVFLSSHPLIRPDSLNILEISSSALSSPTNLANYGSPNEDYYTQQPRQIYNVKLIADYQQPDEELLLRLLLKTGDIGLLEKLRAFKP